MRRPSMEGPPRGGRQRGAEPPPNMGRGQAAPQDRATRAVAGSAPAAPLEDGTTRLGGGEIGRRCTVLRGRGRRGRRGTRRRQRLVWAWRGVVPLHVVADPL